MNYPFKVLKNPDFYTWKVPRQECARRVTGKCELDLTGWRRVEVCRTRGWGCLRIAHMVLLLLCGNFKELCGWRGEEKKSIVFFPLATRQHACRLSSCRKREKFSGFYMNSVRSCLSPLLQQNDIGSCTRQQNSYITDCYHKTLQQISIMN